MDMFRIRRTVLILDSEISDDISGLWFNIGLYIVCHARYIEQCMLFANLIQMISTFHDPINITLMNQSILFFFSWILKNYWPVIESFILPFCQLFSQLFWFSPHILSLSLTIIIYVQHIYHIPALICPQISFILIYTAIIYNCICALGNISPCILVWM